MLLVFQWRLLTRFYGGVALAVIGFFGTIQTDSDWNIDARTMTHRAAGLQLGVQRHQQGTV
jgi:hypothetical protein